MSDKLTISSGYPFEDVFGYARAVRVGDHVFVSGTTARGADLERDAHHQACCVLEIIADALAQAGASLRHVVRTVVYITDRADIDAVARAHGKAFAAVRPASTLVMVAGLTPSSARVEVEATAIIQG
jgi:enamine deaminase RidA (YjgF/YER057c/UK114 family)